MGCQGKLLGAINEVPSLEKIRYSDIFVLPSLHNFSIIRYFYISLFILSNCNRLMKIQLRISGDCSPCFAENLRGYYSFVNQMNVLIKYYLSKSEFLASSPERVWCNCIWNVEIVSIFSLWFCSQKESYYFCNYPCHRNIVIRTLCRVITSIMVW